MVDFFKIVTESPRQGLVRILPEFDTVERADIMTRGEDFYAVWVEDKGIWSTDEDEVKRMIDNELLKFKEEHKDAFADSRIVVKWMRDFGTGSVVKFRAYCKKGLRESFHNLDEKLVFLSDKPKKKDYVSQKRLPYDLIPCDIPNYDRLMSVIYAPEERAKIEWAIGSIITGDSKKNQKFIVLYGAPGTGKSTVINIIEKLFEGYYTAFNAKSLASNNNQFPFEPFKDNPLVAIQHDGDLSKIEDNTYLNSLVSHEYVTVNEKNKSQYMNRFKCFVFMGTNKPVKITDSNSGILRRLIDVTPTGNRLSGSEYREVMNGIDYELGGIACHCRDVYLADPHKYDDYVALNMMEASNDFYNFILDSYFDFEKEDGITRADAYAMYLTYCEKAKVPNPMRERVFNLEIKNYFDEYHERYTLSNGQRVRSFYKGFNGGNFDRRNKKEDNTDYTIEFKNQRSLFDVQMANCPAQYAKTSDGTPSYYWDDVKTKLSDIDTSKLHYVKLDDEHHIVIDFDIPDKDGNKDFEANLKAASKWPKTYAELSKSGAGIHLHYIYIGDPKMLDSIYDDHIEIKVYSGKSSLRRLLTKCNNVPIATISSGLPLKEVKKVDLEFKIKDEDHLINFIKKALRKGFFDSTAQNFKYMYDVVEQTYDEGVISYTISDSLRKDIEMFASSSTHQSDTCMRMLTKMHFKSKDRENLLEDTVEQNERERLVVFDVESAPNLFLICWSFEGEDEPVHVMTNPTQEEVREFMKLPFIGYNNKHYDNHMIYAKATYDYTTQMLHKLSNNMIVQHTGYFPKAYEISKGDIYEIASKKQSLKKWELELRGKHKEMDVDWDKDIPEELWPKVTEYCINDVIETKRVLVAIKADFEAHMILTDISGGSINDSTNTLTTKLILQGERYPKLVWKDLSEEFPGYEFVKGTDNKMHNMYRGEDVGFGGYVYAEPGMYYNVETFDVASMHPSTIIKLNLFGEYTKNFKDLYEARLAIKHKDYASAKKLFDGKLSKYLTDDSQAKGLSQALKIALNSVYGLTSAKFDNPFRDHRNVNNIVALRGALFMVSLRDEVKKMGFKVVHIKTDSIKVQNPTPELRKFVHEYGLKYGYTFETEHVFEKICLVNDAVYIAKCANNDPECPGEWTATGAQFAVPYVFKKCFSKEPITVDDFREVRQVTTNMYLDFNENLPEDEHHYEFIGKVGEFYPMQDGCGAALLLRQDKEKTKYSSVTGTKGYRWMETDMVENLHLEDKIDTRYHEKLVKEAINTISKFGDYEMFVDDEVVSLAAKEDPKPWLQEDSLPEAFDNIKAEDLPF